MEVHLRILVICLSVFICVTYLCVLKTEMLVCWKGEGRHGERGWESEAYEITAEWKR